MKSTLRTQALAAGISLIVMALSAGFSYGYVLSGLEVQGDPVASFGQLATKATLFKFSLAGWLIIFLTDLIVTAALYLFFKGTHLIVSAATAAVRFLYTILLGIALLKLFSIIPLLNDQNMDAETAGRQLQSALESFESIWSLGLIIFGLHLLGLGYLSWHFRPVPRAFAYLLLFAGLSYVVLHTAMSVEGMNEGMMNKLEMVLMTPMALSEILLAFWLIFRGGKK